MLFRIFFEFLVTECFVIEAFRVFLQVLTLFKGGDGGDGGIGGGVNDAWRRSEVASSDCQPSVDVEPTPRNDANRTNTVETFHNC